MELESYDLKDPTRLIEEVAQRVALTEGSAYLVLVALPSTEQRLVAVERMSAPAELDAWKEARDEIYERMQRLPIPDVVPPTRLAVTVVVRRGRCVIGPHEKNRFLAWRYANHLRRCHDSDLMVVTEHGWFDWATEYGGHTPALEAAM